MSIRHEEVITNHTINDVDTVFFFSFVYSCYCTPVSRCFHNSRRHRRHASTIWNAKRDVRYCLLTVCWHRLTLTNIDATDSIAIGDRRRQRKQRRLSRHFPEIFYARQNKILRCHGLWSNSDLCFVCKYVYKIAILYKPKLVACKSHSKLYFNFNLCECLCVGVCRQQVHGRYLHLYAYIMRHKNTITTLEVRGGGGGRIWHTVIRCRYKF